MVTVATVIAMTSNKHINLDLPDTDGTQLSTKLSWTAITVSVWESYIKITSDE